jgi:endonuclease/exonuclease/phosphatase family metal-dependent hydrolase
MATALRTFSYNTHLFFNTVVALGPHTVFDDATRLDKIAERVLSESPDIVGFSEVWANSSKDSFKTLMSGTYPYSAFDGNTNPKEVGSGLLLLSRFPIKTSAFTKYTLLAGADFFSQKGFILATIDTGAGDLMVALTHTQADEGVLEVQARKSNIKQLVAGIAPWTANTTPAVVLGDLNIIGEDADGMPTNQYRSLTNHLTPLGLTDAYRVLHPDAIADPGYTYNAVTNKLIAQFAPADAKNKVKQRIDYLFTRIFSPASAEVVLSYVYPMDGGEMDLSDHYPLQGTMN